jgi:hypothetical protein
MLDDDRYAGERVGTVAVLVAAVVGATLIASLVALLVLAFRRRGRFGPAPPRGDVLLFAGSWIVVHVILVVRLSPGAPETWVGVLLPAWMVIALVLHRAEAAIPKWVIALPIGLLAMHNLVAGLWVVRSESVDYNAQKAAWLLDVAGPGDAIVTADVTGFSRYLTYRSAARVIPLDEITAEEFGAMYDHFEASEGRVYLTGDVLAPPPRFEARSPEDAEVLSQFADEIRADAELVHADDFGGVYQLR